MKELSQHQRGIILRGICNGAALQNKQPQISDNNTVITCPFPLSCWDICSISCDAEAFGLKARFGYNGTTRITFSHQQKEDKEKVTPIPTPIYHCTQCGSTHVTPPAWCNNCGKHTTLTEHSEFMQQIEYWWKEGATGEDYEVITGLDEDDFSPDDNGEKFIAACNTVWNAKTAEQKIEIWQTITNREDD